MKILATIKTVAITRQYQRQDGTFGNVYGVTLESGDDVILAETFVNKEGQERRGILPGNIGTARIELSVRDWRDRNGNDHQTQDIRLADFQPAQNRKASDNAPATEAAKAEPETQATAQPTPEQVVKKAVEAAEQAKVEGTDLPF